MDLSCVNAARAVHYDCNSLHVDAFDVAIPYICMQTKEAQTSLFSAVQNKLSWKDDDHKGK